MKKLLLMGLLVSMLGLVPGLAAANGGAGLPMAQGQTVIDYITHSAPYQNWQLWPGKGELYEGQHPHGAFLTTYLNEAALSAVQDKSGVMPDGAIIVKENYTPEMKLAAVTVMYKKKGYDPDGGDYFWLKYAPDGTIEKEGKVDGCINCHGSVRNNDWLFTGPIR